MEPIRSLSKMLFGAFYRLEIGAAITSGTVFTATSLYESLGHKPSFSCVSKELGVFEDSGLLIREPQVQGMRSVYLRAREASFWQTCRDLCASVHGAAHFTYPEPQPTKKEGQ